MATRRMFSIRVTSSARFLKMPISSQALYFHLGQHADDDGIVEAYPVLMKVGCSEDDLKVLTSKGFIQVLNEDLVSYITDWRENNKIRADRKIDSIYKDLLVSMNPSVDLLESKERADKKGGRPMDVQWTTNGQPMDRIGKDRLGKDSIGEDRKEKKWKSKFSTPTLHDVQAYCFERGNNVDPNRFIDYYSSNGWMVGRNKMKDWKAAVRTWERSEKKDKISEGYDMMARWAETEDT